MKLLPDLCLLKASAFIYACEEVLSQVRVTPVERLICISYHPSLY